MPNQSGAESGGVDEQSDRVFKALADRTRRAMVERLARGPLTVSDLAAPLDMALPSVMQHLSILEGAGIAQSQKIGRVRTVQLVPGALDGATAWLRQQRTAAERQADRLVAFVENSTPHPHQEKP